MRKVYVLGVVMLLAGAVLALPRLLPGQSNSVAAQDAQTAAVERISLNTSIDSTGTVAAERTIYLTFGTQGTVNKVNVQVGDSVKAGEVVAELNTNDLEYQISLKEQALVVQQTAYDNLVAPPTAAELAQAQANLTSAQSQLQSAQTSQAAAPNQTTINCSSVNSNQLKLETAQENYDEYVKDGYGWDATFIPDPDSTTGQALSSAQSVYDVAVAQCSNTTPAADYEVKLSAAQAAVGQAQANLDSLKSGPTPEDIASSEAKVKQAQLELDNVRANLSDAVITAPFDGVISAVNIVIGQAVTTATSAVTLLDNSQLHVDVTVDEQDVTQVKVGQNAIIILDALSDTTIEGLVSRIPPAGTAVDGVVTYNVRIDLTNIDNLNILVGMTSDVQIVTASQDGVLVVPTEAIQRNASTEFVQLYNTDRSTTTVPVTTGSTSDGLTVISGDITEGALVVIPQADNQQAAGVGPFGGGN